MTERFDGVAASAATFTRYPLHVSGPRRFRKSSHTKLERFDAKHRFEHWYLDNQVYFLTARCRERFPAFASDDAKRVFWDRFDHWTAEHGFAPIVTSLLDNHYHALGYLKVGENLGPMMQRLHGSVAKLVNDLLPERRAKFWVDYGHHNYFDGCIRDARQFSKCFRYTHTQCRRHGVCADPADYPHTRVSVGHDRALKRAIQLDAFLENVAYPRYGEQPGARGR